MTIETAFFAHHSPNRFDNNPSHKIFIWWENKKKRARIDNETFLLCENLLNLNVNDTSFCNLDMNLLIVEKRFYESEDIMWTSHFSSRQISFENFYVYCIVTLRWHHSFFRFRRLLSKCLCLTNWLLWVLLHVDKDIYTCLEDRNTSVANWMMVN